MPNLRPDHNGTQRSQFESKKYMKLFEKSFFEKIS